MLLMIDNYDSFTYNLVQYFGELGQQVRVFRNDAITLDGIAKLNPEMIVISPGPGRPCDAGISKAVIQHFTGVYPLLGVCLGHQCIGEVFGAAVVRAGRIMHGKTSAVFHDGKSLYKNLPKPFEATRYHSLIIKKDTLPDCLAVSAWTDHDEIMGIRHRTHPVEGIQFHPESVLTSCGKELLGNFLEEAARFHKSKSGKGRAAV
jgi:anthranilate synthase/aminodeoxychorismate synthase-like glutamine amidotransferase